ERDPIQGHARARLGRALLAQGQRARGLRELDAGLAILRASDATDPDALAEAEGWRTDPR
ncbi:MAG: hypothetical protein AAFQ43_08500, partial [Bacteroidota bacterium]